MNQEQNNLNTNSFSTQENNRIPNNQPLQNNQGVGVNQQPINPESPSTLSYQQSINQTNMQQPTPQTINTFESGNVSNQSFNSKSSKKINLGLIIGIVAVVAVIGVGIVFGSKLLSRSDENLDKDFYVVSGTQDKGSLAMATNFESEKINNYNYIEKYNMKWITEGKLFIMSIPVIPNRTYSLNSYSLHSVKMDSELLDVTYDIFSEDEFKVNKSNVEVLSQDLIAEYSGPDSFYKLNKNTDVIEKNGVLGYAYSIKTVYSTQIRIWYYIKIDNSISTTNYYLVGFISFDLNNYENVKPIIDELSNTINFDLIDLADKAK